MKRLHAGLISQKQRGSTPRARYADDVRDARDFIRRGELGFESPRRHRRLSGESEGPTNPCERSDSAASDRCVRAVLADSLIRSPSSCNSRRTDKRATR